MSASTRTKRDGHKAHGGSKRKRSARMERPPAKEGSTAALNIARSLGATHAFKVQTRPRGPFGAAALLDEIRSRLVSRGGRPSDPEANLRRLVPLRETVWVDLQRHAETLSAQGRPVSAGQLAAILLERGVSELGGPEQKK